jgi:replicative DNA helicase
MEEVDTLKKYGSEFQAKAILCLLKEHKFIEQIFDICAVEYFEGDANRWIVEKIKDYFIKYKSTPTGNVFKVEVDRIENIILKTTINEQLKVIASKAKDTDLPYVKEQFLEFCRNQKLKNAIISSVDYLKLGQYDQIKHVVDEAMKAGMERNIGHDYFNDVNIRMSEMARHIVPTGWDPIDDLLDGGLAKGELGFVVAPAGAGKSWLLSHLGTEAMKQGKNVMHFTLELNENYVGLRYDACFTKISFQDVRKNVDVVKQKIEEIKGKLFIKFFPIKTVAAQTLKMHIERVQMLTGVKIDLIILDYADLLRPLTADKNANSYSEAGSVYEELRAIAGELQVPIWSASQAHRGAHEADTIQAHNVADSYRKIMTGDFVFSLSRKSDDKTSDTARIHIIKNRFGADGMTFPTYFNSSNGDIKVFLENSPQGIELKQKMQDHEDHTKDVMRDHWNQIKKDKNFTDDE